MVSSGNVDVLNGKNGDERECGKITTVMQELEMLRNTMGETGKLGGNGKLGEELQTTLREKDGTLAELQKQCDGLCQKQTTILEEL
jgi:hypothetical protein